MKYIQHICIRNVIAAKLENFVLMLSGRFNPPLCCVKIIENKTLNTCRDMRPSQAIEVKKNRNAY